MAQTESIVSLNEKFKSSAENARYGVGLIEIEPNDNKTSSMVEIDCQNNNDNSGRTVFSRSEVHRMYQSFPFGFRTPENCSNSVCRWIYPITFGGGLVGGDHIEVRFDIGQRCCVVICTQEITKVYHCLQTTETTRQSMDFRLKEDCLLCVLPDPLVCYRDARFQQKQTFHMCPTSNLVFLDWLQAGRKALGESWDFQRYCSTIEIYFSNKLVLRECNDLQSTHSVDLGKSMGKFEFLGTCVILGPHLSSLSHIVEETFACKKGFGEKQSDSLVVSVSPLSYNVGGDQLSGCYVRFLAIDMDAASVFIKSITQPLLSDLGADPFERKL